MSDDVIRRLLGTNAGVGEEPGNDIKFHQGTVIAWNSTNFTNSINVAGTVLNNLPVLTSAGLISLRVNDPVVVMQYKAGFFVLGRVVSLASQLSEPQFPIVLYPMFQPNIPVNTAGYAIVTVGTLVSWEGRIRASHPKIEVDGIWGTASGTNTTTYQLVLNNNTIGIWSVVNTLQVQRYGPFDISSYIGLDWLKIELKITASSGTGQVAIQPLGVYFRQS